MPVDLSNIIDFEAAVETARSEGFVQFLRG
jgi:hypothetical protein